jgi:hypothetical protein
MKPKAFCVQPTFLAKKAQCLFNKKAKCRDEHQKTSMKQVFGLKQEGLGE